MSKKPTVLLIMDGFGLAPAGPENAISCAKTPNLDKLFAECPNTQLQASGLDVGLPAGQMGNSEVGHTNIGADVKLRPGRLCDLCPTMLDLMGLSKPAQMTGESLIVK